MTQTTSRSDKLIGCLVPLYIALEVAKEGIGSIPAVVKEALSYFVPAAAVIKKGIGQTCKSVQPLIVTPIEKAAGFVDETARIGFEGTKYIHYTLLQCSKEISHLSGLTGEICSGQVKEAHSYLNSGKLVADRSLKSSLMRMNECLEPVLAHTKDLTLEIPNYGIVDMARLVNRLSMVPLEEIYIAFKEMPTVKEFVDFGKAGFGRSIDESKKNAFIFKEIVVLTSSMLSKEVCESGTYFMSSSVVLRKTAKKSHEMVVFFVIFVLKRGMTETGSYPTSMKSSIFRSCRSRLTQVKEIKHTFIKLSRGLASEDYLLACTSAGVNTCTAISFKEMASLVGEAIKPTREVSTYIVIFKRQIVRLSSLSSKTACLVLNVSYALTRKLTSEIESYPKIALKSVNNSVEGAIHSVNEFSSDIMDVLIGDLLKEIYHISLQFGKNFANSTVYIGFKTLGASKLVFNTIIQITKENGSYVSSALHESRRLSKKCVQSVKDLRDTPAILKLFQETATYPLTMKSIHRTLALTYSQIKEPALEIGIHSVILLTEIFDFLANISTTTFKELRALQSNLKEGKSVSTVAFIQIGRECLSYPMKNFTFNRFQDQNIFLAEIGRLVVELTQYPKVLVESSKKEVTHLAEMGAETMALSPLLNLVHECMALFMDTRKEVGQRMVELGQIGKELNRNLTPAIGRIVNEEIAVLLDSNREFKHCLTELEEMGNDLDNHLTPAIKNMINEEINFFRAGGGESKKMTGEFFKKTQEIKADLSIPLNTVGEDGFSYLPASIHQLEKTKKFLQEDCPSSFEHFIKNPVYLKYLKAKRKYDGIIEEFENAKRRFFERLNQT